VLQVRVARCFARVAKVRLKAGRRNRAPGRRGAVAHDGDGNRVDGEVSDGWGCAPTARMNLVAGRRGARRPGHAGAAPALAAPAAAGA